MVQPHKGRTAVEYPPRMKLRPVVQQPIMANRTWNPAMRSNMAVTERSR